MSYNKKITLPVLQYYDSKIKPYISNLISTLNSNLTSEIIRAKETEETLKSRIDTITSLPEGSTTGDAELQDIRVKADGTIAENAGNAVREQFSELKGDIDSVIDVDIWKTQENNFLNDYKYETVIPTFYTDKWIKENGEIQDEKSGYFLAEIKVKGAEQYLINNFVGYIPAHYVITDSKGNVMDYYHTAESFTVMNNKLVNIPFGASKLYLSVTSSAKENSDLFSVRKITEKSVKLPECIEKIENIFDYNSDGNVVGKYYAFNSFEEQTSDVLNTTHFIEVFKGDKIVFKRSVSWIVEKYNFSLWQKKEISSSSFLPVTEYTLENDIFTITVPQNCYLTATYHKDKAENFVILRNVSNFYSEVLPYGSYYYATNNLKLKNYNDKLYNKSAIFVGDSICEGLNGGSVLGWSYAINENNPTMTCLNYGKSGACVGYHADESVINVLTQIDNAFNEHESVDFIIIEGGVNDAWSGGKIQVGDLSSDYETFNDSVFAQALEHVFYKAMTYYPDAKIGYIIPQVRTDNSEIYMNKAIEVCEKWSVPYIDFRFNFGFSYHLPNIQEKYFKGTVTDDTTHPNALAYQEILAPKIEAWMRTL